MTDGLGLDRRQMRAAPEQTGRALAGDPAAAVGGPPINGDLARARETAAGALSGGRRLALRGVAHCSLSCGRNQATLKWLESWSIVFGVRQFVAKSPQPRNVCGDGQLQQVRIFVFAGQANH